MEKNTNEYVDFVVTARKYKTLLTTKYVNRPVWHKPIAGEVLSTLPGTITSVEVKVGQRVKTGQLLLIHEAMKMYNRIVAPVDGVVKEILVTTGESISKNYLMIRIDPQ